MSDDAVDTTESLILTSRLFRSKPQMKRLLTYLVKHTYKNDNDALQQRSIALSCLGRDRSFDSTKDPIVRIEAARLRKLLEEYYDCEDAKQTPLRVSLPKGSYRLVFSKNSEHRQSSSYSLLLLCQSPMVSNSAELQLMVKLRRGLSNRLNHFNHLNLIVNFHPEHEVAQRGSVHFLAEEQYDYVMRLEVVQDRGCDFLVSSIVVHRITQEILWSHSITLYENYTPAVLNDFYLKLISPLVADSYGVLGNHWAKSYLDMGLDYVEDQHMAAVQFISLCNNPSKEACIELLEFLDARLKKYPDDFNAHGSYLAVGLLDYFLNYNLMPASLESRLDHSLNLDKYSPNDAGVSILIGFYYFAMNRLDESEIYLSNARKLNPYNTMWDFIYGALLLFRGRTEEGFQIVSKITKYNATPPGYFAIPSFFYYMARGERENAFKASAKIARMGSLESLIKAIAYLSVGAKKQAKEEWRKVKNTSDNDSAFLWVETRLLRNNPKLILQFNTMLKRLSLLA